MPVAHSAPTPTSGPAVTQTLATLLNVRDAARAIAFYKLAFNAVEALRIEDDGSVVARLTLGTFDVWVADESPAHQNFSPETLGGSTVRMILTTADPDAAFDRAVAAGATVIHPVADQPYGWRLGRLVDPFGHHWEIGRPIS